jgi:hypothetical protein
VQRGGGISFTCVHAPSSTATFFTLLATCAHLGPRTVQAAVACQQLLTVRGSHTTPAAAAAPGQRPVLSPSRLPLRQTASLHCWHVPHQLLHSVQLTSHAQDMFLKEVSGMLCFSCSCAVSAPAACLLCLLLPASERSGVSTRMRELANASRVCAVEYAASDADAS